MASNQNNNLRRATFAAQLRTAIDEHEISVRELAHRLNPDSPESARSHLHKWLRGAHVPSRTSRRAVARALDLPAEHFNGDEDDEEAAESVGSLDVILRSYVRKLIAEERSVPA